MHLKGIQEVEIVDSKDPLVQLEASKSSNKMVGNIEYSSVYFNSATKTD